MFGVQTLGYSPAHGVAASWLQQPWEPWRPPVEPKLTKREANKLKRVLESISPMTIVLIQASLDAIDYVRTARSVTEHGLKAFFGPWEPTTSILPDTIAFWDRVDELDFWETPELLKELFVEARTRRVQANSVRRERKTNQYS